MKDRFAADWRTGIATKRHKGERVGTLWGDFDGNSGDVTLTEAFSREHPLYRADVLKDIIGLLESEYQRAVQQEFRPDEPLDDD